MSVSETRQHTTRVQQTTPTENVRYQKWNGELVRRVCSTANVKCMQKENAVTV